MTTSHHAAFGSPYALFMQYSTELLHHTEPDLSRPGAKMARYLHTFMRTQSRPHT